MIPSSGPTGSLRTSALPPMPGPAGVGEQRRALVGVVAVDRGDELELALALAQRLAHLAGDDRGELVGPLVVEVGDPVQHPRALVLAVVRHSAYAAWLRASASCTSASVAVGYSFSTSPVDGLTTW